MYGVIGDWGLRAEDFKRALDSVNASLIHVNINSPGGDVFAGVAAYNLLIEHGARIEVRVHGLAASAASVIAMAGDDIVMGDGSFLMIHNAWTIAIGDTREMGKTARVLAQIDKELAKLYADKSGQDVDAVKDMMDAETWFSADDAIEEGFATAKAKAADKNAATKFDLATFKNAPKALIKRRQKMPPPAAQSPRTADGMADVAAILKRAMAA